MRPTETPRPAVLNSEMRWVPPSSRSMPAVPTRSTTRAVDLSLKRQIALPEIAVTAPTCTRQQELTMISVLPNKAILPPFCVGQQITNTRGTARLSTGWLLQLHPCAKLKSYYTLNQHNWPERHTQCVCWVGKASDQLFRRAGGSRQGARW